MAKKRKIIYSPKEKIEKTNKKTDKKIALTDEMCEFFRSERKRIKISQNVVGNELGILGITIRRIELKQIKTIQEELYNELISFYSNRKSIPKYPKGARVSITDKARKFFKSERERLGISTKTLASEIGVSYSTIERIESKSSKTILKEIYNKLVNFYSNEEKRRKYYNEMIIPITDEMRELLRGERKKAGITIKTITQNIGISKTSMTEMELGGVKNIQRELYERIITFYGDKDKWVNYSKERRILMTREMRELLKAERKKLGISLNVLAKNMYVATTRMGNIERGKVETISEELWSKLMNFFRDEKNCANMVREERITLTDEVHELLESGRKKIGVTGKIVADNISVLPELLYAIEGRTIKTISHDVYKKLIDFYTDENNIVKYSKEARIYLTDEIREFLKAGRKKTGITGKFLAQNVGVSPMILHKLESGVAKTIQRDMYEKMIALYSDKDKWEKHSKERRILLTREMRKLLKVERMKTQISLESMAKNMDVSPTRMGNIENGKIETISNELWNNLINFYSDENNTVIDLKDIRIFETREMKESFKSTRKKVGVSREIVDVLDTAIIKSIKSEQTERISEEPSSKSISFYGEKKNSPEKTEASRIFVTDEMREFFKSERQKLGVSWQTIANKSGVLFNIIKYIEYGRIKTISEDAYKKLMDFYSDEENCMRIIKEGQIIVTVEVRELLASERKKQG